MNAPALHVCISLRHYTMCYVALRNAVSEKKKELSVPILHVSHTLVNVIKLNNKTLLIAINLTRFTVVHLQSNRTHIGQSHLHVLSCFC